LTLILAAASGVLALGPAVRLALYQHDHPTVSVSDPRLWPAPLAKPVVSPGTRRPDIYVLIPDDYARLDVLRRYFRYPDSSFVAALKRRGFVISPQARTPYSDSEMNIAAELNMGYLDGLGRILGSRSQDVRPVKRLIQDNRASRLLSSLGYRYVHLDTDEVTFAGSNPHISRFAPPDSFANLWGHNTALRLFGGALGFDTHATNDRFRHSVRSVFAQLDALPRLPGPKFVVFHTLLPHDPYIFGSDGQAITFPGHTDDSLGSRLGMRYYLGQLRYLNGELLRTIDAIRARSGTPPAIVLQSDEGFQAASSTFGEATMQQIRVKGLLALSLPGLKGVRAPQPPTTVNTLRYLLNRYFGTHYPLLRAASYPELDFPYQFEEMRVK
jgi:hypothetical protein